MIYKEYYEWLSCDLNACHVVKKSNIAQGKTNSVTSSSNDI